MAARLPLIGWPATVRGAMSAACACLAAHYWLGPAAAIPSPWVAAAREVGNPAHVAPAGSPATLSSYIVPYFCKADIPCNVAHAGRQRIREQQIFAPKCFRQKGQDVLFGTTE